MSNNSQFSEEEISAEKDRYLQQTNANKHQFNKFRLLMNAVTAMSPAFPDDAISQKTKSLFNTSDDRLDDDKLREIAIRNLKRQAIAKHNALITDTNRKMRIKKKREERSLKKQAKR